VFFVLTFSLGAMMARAESPRSLLFCPFLPLMRRLVVADRGAAWSAGWCCEAVACCDWNKGEN